MLVTVIISVLLALMIYVNEEHNLTYHGGENSFHTVIAATAVSILYVQQYSLFITNIGRNHLAIACVISLATTIAIALTAILLAHIKCKVQNQKKDKVQ